SGVDLLVSFTIFLLAILPLRSYPGTMANGPPTHPPLLTVATGRGIPATAHHQWFSTPQDAFQTYQSNSDMSAPAGLVPAKCAKSAARAPAFLSPLVYQLQRQHLAWIFHKKAQTSCKSLIEWKV